nr:MAG TPA: hypothetical protein [Caudoviricetes sp.]
MERALTGRTHAIKNMEGVKTKMTTPQSYNL